MYTIGIDVGGTNLKAGLVNEHYEIEATAKMPLCWESAEKFAADLVRLAKSVVEQKGIALSEVSGIGIGVPGQVDNKNGLIVKTVNIPIRNMPIAKLMQAEWDVPIYLGNDADCAALGEFYHFEDRSIENLVLVTLGTGVGTGLVINGRIHRGVNGCAGEGGHIVIVKDGEQCTCGRRGCWERYSSATALIRMTREAMEQDKTSALWEISDNGASITGVTPFEGAKRGDAAAIAVLESYVAYLAEGITNLINLLQPEVIAIGGGVSAADDRWLLDPVRRKVEELRYDKEADVHTKIVKAKLGNDAGIIGAALLGK